MRIPTPTPSLVTPEGLALSDSEKAKVLAGSLKAQIQPAKDPSVAALIEEVNEAMRTYSIELASEPKLTKPKECKTKYGVSKFERHRAQMVFPIGP